VHVVTEHTNTEIAAAAQKPAHDSAGVVVVGIEASIGRHRFTDRALTVLLVVDPTPHLNGESELPGDATSADGWVITDVMIAGILGLPRPCCRITSKQLAVVTGLA